MQWEGERGGGWEGTQAASTARRLSSRCGRAFARCSALSEWLEEWKLREEEESQSHCKFWILYDFKSKSSFRTHIKSQYNQHRSRYWRLGCRWSVETLDKVSSLSKQVESLETHQFTSNAFKINTIFFNFAAVKLINLIYNYLADGIWES